MLEATLQKKKNLAILTDMHMRNNETHPISWTVQNITIMDSSAQTSGYRHQFFYTCFTYVPYF